MPETVNGSSEPVPDPIVEREYQQLWLTLSRTEWSSIVVVSAGSGAAAEIANRLVDVGRRLSSGALTAIVISRMDYDVARALTDLQQYAHRARRSLPEPSVVEVRPPTQAPSASAGEAQSQALALAPSSQVVIAIPAVVDDPLGIAVARQADIVLLAIDMGQTQLAAARRTIQLIGRERIAGCVVRT